MPHRPVSLHAPRGSVAAAEIRAAIDELLATDFADVPQEFPAHVLAEAEAAVADARDSLDRVDATGIAFVTLDPQESTDLDQAMHLERTEQGYRVRYAIADVPLFVRLDSALDHEARERGTTVYLPDRRIPLHPQVISEQAGSLLPDQVTPAFVWDLTLDERGEVTAVALDRAMVRSREKLAYDQVQADLDRGEGHPMMVLLQEIGDLRTQLEAERGGASLNVPEHEVVIEESTVRLQWRRPNPIEDANAQISLLTGMAAAALMLEHGVGILRTMPPAEKRAIARFRRQTEIAGVPWSEDVSYGDYLRSLTWSDPKQLAVLNHAASLFRGAAYAAFTSAEEAPKDPVQAAIAAPYAHTTAPLRRLVDRFVLLVCCAHANKQPVPPALKEALPLIPEIMKHTGSRASNLERRAQNVVELASLRDWIGEEFTAAVIERREHSPGAEGKDGTPTRVEVQLLDPPVSAWVPMDAALGEVVRVRLESVDLGRRKAVFAPVDREPTGQL